jgi:hypothetical protein
MNKKLNGNDEFELESLVYYVYVRTLENNEQDITVLAAGLEAKQATSSCESIYARDGVASGALQDSQSGLSSLESSTKSNY